MKYSGFDLREVKAAAQGNWFMILEVLAPGVFAEAIQRGYRKHSRCPFHQTGNSSGKSFRFDRNGNEKGSAICSCHAWADGFDLLMDLQNWNFATTVHEVGSALGISANDSNSESSNGNEQKMVVAKKPQWLIDREKKHAADRERELRSMDWVRGRLKEVWAETVPLSSPQAAPARKYLESRGVATLPDLPGCRFHPSLPFYDEEGKKVATYPAIVGCLQSAEGDFVTLHRHYLTEEGKKAPIDEPKKMAPVHDNYCCTGAAIRLATPQKGVVGIAEGIETALSAWTGLGVPTWAAVSASIMKSFTPPEQSAIHTVIIFADKDRSEAGKEASLELKRKLVAQGYEVLIMAPPMRLPPSSKSIDWNDVLVTQGICGFPSISQVLQRLPRHAQYLAGSQHAA